MRFQENLLISKQDLNVVNLGPRHFGDGHNH